MNKKATLKTMIEKYIRLLLSASMLFFIYSCTTQINLTQKTDFKAIIPKGNIIYEPDSVSLGTGKAIVLEKDLVTRVLFRDAAKSNLSDTQVFVTDLETQHHSDKSIIKVGKPYYLLPRTAYGKTIDYDAVFKMKTHSRNIGVLINPYQVFFTTSKPLYVEANYGNGRFKGGLTYTWNYTTHTFKELLYQKSTLGFGPYFLIGTTNVSDVSIDQSSLENINLQFKNKPVFGISIGGIINYQLNDFFGVGLLIGHEMIFNNAYKEIWVFNKNNVSLGWVFTFRFSRM